MFFEFLSLGKRQVKQSKKMKESLMFSGTEVLNESTQDKSAVDVENSPFSRGSGRKKMPYILFLLLKYVCTVKENVCHPWPLY